MIIAAIATLICASCGKSAISNAEAAEKLNDYVNSRRKPTITIFSPVHERTPNFNDEYLDKFEQVKNLGIWDCEIKLVKEYGDYAPPARAMVITAIHEKGQPLMEKVKGWLCYDETPGAMYELQVGTYQVEVSSIGEPITDGRGFLACHVNYLYRAIPNDVGKIFGEPQPRVWEAKAMFTKQNGVWVLEGE